MYSGRETKGTIIRSNFHKRGLRTNISLLQSQVAQVSLPGRETARIPPRVSRKGQAIPATVLHPGIRELAELPCPPPPLFDRLGVKPKRTVVTFVQKDSSASAIHLRRLAGQYGQEEGEQSSKVVVVIDRANPRETESLKNELGLDFVMFADPTGKITDRFRVGVWPTTIKLDRHGIVLEVQIGVAGRARDDRTDAELPHQSHSAL
jgi:hypothetical protein